MRLDYIGYFVLFHINMVYLRVVALEYQDGALTLGQAIWDVVTTAAIFTPILYFIGRYFCFALSGRAKF